MKKKAAPAPAPPGESKKYTYLRRTFTYEGTQYEVTGKTEAECHEKIGLKKAALARGEVGISSGMTVRAWCKTFVETYVTPRVREEGANKRTKNSLTAKSAQMYGQKIGGYIVPAIGALRLKEVKAAHLQKIINSQAGASFSHVNKLMNVTQQLFRRAYLDRLILFDPSADLARPDVERNTRRSLTAQELQVFCAVAATHKHGLWAEFHLRMGTRSGEVPPIQIKDLDFTSHRLHVSKAVESGTKTVKEPKTSAGDRFIPIPADFEPALKAHTAGRAPFDYLFPGEGGGMMTQSGINRRWRSFKRAMDLSMGAELDRHGKVIPETSKVAKDLTLHCLRHTFCTRLGELGIDASIGRFVTGHADVSTLSNIYTHSNDTILQLIADKLNASTPPAPKQSAGGKTP